jgi:hypothetical protein
MLRLAMKGAEVPMMRTATILTVPLTFLALATGCSDSTGPRESPQGKTANGTTEASVLVDASRDGGVWWFPQAGPFDPEGDHQGKALADFLRSTGYRVDELGRPTTITLSLLQAYAIVIRAGEFGGYTGGEISAYRQYVGAGGRLLLLADHMRFAPPDDLGRSFGLVFAGITRGENLLQLRAGHPITSGLSSLYYGVGSALMSAPDSALILGTLDSASYVDLDDNGVQGAGEPSAPPVFGAMTFGSGRIVFCGDLNLWEWDASRGLVDNVLAWLREGTGL